MEKTKNYNLNKPAPDDFYDVNDFNDNADLIDTELKHHENSLASKADLVNGKVPESQLPVLSDDIDCGSWEETPVMLHAASPNAHQNLNIDGNAGATSGLDEELATHLINPDAHQNLNVDGNNN